VIDAPSGKSPPVVLVVEDEPLLRMMAVEVVEEAGFVALEAANADEAVALLESRLDIALLFTDIDMPGSMDGLKLAHAVRGRWPPIKILVVSGKVRLQPSQLPSGSRFVGKPYRAAAMVEELRSLVGPAYSSMEPPLGGLSDLFCSDLPLKELQSDGANPTAQEKPLSEHT
jgi:two-component system, response regulator PdtaR